MNYQKPYRVHQPPKNNNLWQVLAIVAIALVLSLAIALAWQKVSGDSGDPVPASAPSQPASSRAEEPASQASSEQASSVEASSQASSAPESAQESSAPQNDAAYGEPLPETERVRSDYFDDAVFVGDSITSGISLYQIMDNADVLADTGVNFDTIYTKESVRQEDGTRIPIMDALAQKQYAKVYVMLGGNEVGGDSEEFFLARYGSVLDDIKAMQPNAIIYVQSMLPVTRNNNYGLDNAKIDQFNQALMGLCAEKEVYYLNVAECMKDENGMLPDEASPADGMHFGPDYYSKWFEYLKRHTVA